MSVGKLLRVPPSTSTMPSVRTGSKSPGTDMVERIASWSDPSPQFLALQLMRSAATHMYGIWKSLNDILSWKPTVRLAMRLPTLRPEASPDGSELAIDFFSYSSPSVLPTPSSSTSAAAWKGIVMTYCVLYCLVE